MSECSGTPKSESDKAHTEAQRIGIHLKIHLEKKRSHSEDEEDDADDPLFEERHPLDLEL